MGFTHIVTRGEHMSSIARRFGFASYRTLWDLPENADLRAARNPNVLAPGDAVFIPDKITRTEGRPAGQRHRFFLAGPVPRLRVVLLDLHGAPRAGVDCTLTVGRSAHALKTDDEGQVEAVIPADAREATLHLPEGDVPLFIGALEPVENDLGWKDRLVNMGYLTGQQDDEATDDEVHLALEEFQADHGLPMTGALDDATEAWLRQVYGC